MCIVKLKQETNYDLGHIIISYQEASAHVNEIKEKCQKKKNYHLYFEKVQGRN